MRAAATEHLSSSDVQRASRRLAGRTVVTPVLRSDELDELAGARLWLKTENLQRGGAFKLRGALLAVGRLAAGRSRGVVAQSTGNHAIAVALAARELGLPAVLVLPEDVPPAKASRIAAAGADVVKAGTTLAERSAEASRIVAARGYDLVDPYEDPDVVAGQGTATAEFLGQVSAAGGCLDGLVIPVGGGSALAGGCLAAQGQDIAVIGAEPAAVPALTEALRAGHPVTVRAAPTIADGLRPDTIGQLPLHICRAAAVQVVTVTEPAIAEAMRVALLRARLLIEPAAAAALAAALRLAAGRFHGRDLGVLLSGGNVSADLVGAVLAGRH
jgi:threo-3-hydroxy-L-aspartate ammonia-lyase